MQPQAHFVYSTAAGGWVEAPRATPFNRHGQDDNELPPEKINLLVTWNIDFVTPDPEERMQAAMHHLRKHVQPEEGGPPTYHHAVRNDRFGYETTHRGRLDSQPLCPSPTLTPDVGPIDWYGTVTLVDRRLAVQRAFRVPFESRFGRDGLFVDVDVAAAADSATGDSNAPFSRFCNTHLESLPRQPSLRPGQVALVAWFLRASRTAAAAATTPWRHRRGRLQRHRALRSHVTLSDNGLRDAYLELCGREDSDEGYTLGFQSTEAHIGFPPTRTDKVLYCGRVTVESLERIGVGVTVSPDKTKDTGSDDDGEKWVCRMTMGSKRSLRCFPTFRSPIRQL
jgi:tyrosyl-DNA phosphodiesterase 2